MKKVLFGLSLIISFSLSCNLVWGDFYVIAVGKKAKQTVLVSPKSTALESGTALLNALSKITDASASKPYLIIIEPGQYDIGSNSLQMKSYVDIQGSKKNITKITGSIASGTHGVVTGADNSELRFLTVINLGSGSTKVAIYNPSASPAITNVTAIASGGAGSFNYGVLNLSSFPTMTNVKAKATGGTYSYGVYNNGGSSPIMNDVTAEAVGATNNYGVFNITSSPVMRNVTAVGSGGSYNYGIYNTSLTNTIVITSVTANAWGSPGSDNYGIYNHSSPSTLIDVQAKGSGGTNNYGVYNTGVSLVMIDHSVIIGLTNTVFTNSSLPTYIGNTRLAGGAVSDTGTGGCGCGGVYDESWIFSASTCP